MEPRLAKRQRIESRRRLEEVVSPPRPLLRPAPRAAMFFPIVLVAAVLPGLYALNWWDLNPPGPWWGLRGLAVLDGRFLDQVPAPGLGPEPEARVYRGVAMQPPLYAWLEAVGLAVSAHRAPLATVLPSYAAGALVVVLIFLHGRLWGSPGLGLVAAVLTAFNRDLLAQMQQASPFTLGLAGVLGALLCYGQHLRSPQGRHSGWIALGGLSLAVSLLAVGLFGLICVPIILLHQLYLGADPAATARKTWWRAWLASSTLPAGAIALVIGVALASPWYLMMVKAHGAEFLSAIAAPPGSGEEGEPTLFGILVALSPATLPLGLYAAARAIRLALAAELDDATTVGGTLWLLWLAVAALGPAFWPSGPRAELKLFLLVPLNLFAAQAIMDLASRRIPVRTLTWLAPATACSIAWSISSDLRGAMIHLVQGRRLSAGTALGLHLGVDLIVILVLVTRRLDRWATRRDHRRRFVLAGFLLTVFLVTVGTGLREVRFRHRETSELLDLRNVVLRRQAVRPFSVVAVVGPDSDFRLRPSIPPGGRLRFILRSTLPTLSQIDLAKVDDLFKLPGGNRLVIMIGTNQRLTYSAQSRLGLETIHPGRSGVLDAFATVHVPQRRVRR
jgi:hypothetical protein